MADVGAQVPVHAHRRAGQAALSVERVQGESAVTACYATSPMRLLTPRSRGTSVWACSSSFGGGLLAGDETHLDLALGAGARCFLGTQASTKVYRSPDRIPTRHGTRATLGAGSLLVFAPDPIQPFAHSCYEQSQSFHLADGASLFLLDWCSAGRVATGERWGFRSFRSRNEVGMDGRRVFLDALHLEPAAGSLAAPHQLGRFNALATLLLVGPALREASTRLLARLRQEPVARRGDLVASASPVADGVVLRLAAVHLEAAAAELHRELAGLSHLLADDPWSRKW